MKRISQWDVNRIHHIQNKNVPVCMRSCEPLALLYFPGTVGIGCVTKHFCLGTSPPSDVHCREPVSLPRRPPAPAQPWACCHSIIPTCLPSFWEHAVSQGSHQPLLKLPSAVASQSLGRREVFIRKPVSRGAPWRMEGIRENKYPLHCGLSDLSHPSSWPSKHPTKTNSC